VERSPAGKSALNDGQAFVRVSAALAPWVSVTA